MFVSERARKRSMNLSLVAGGVGVFWFIVCFPQQILSLYVRNALNAPPSLWGLMAGAMQATGLANLVSIPLYARSRSRKRTWILVTGLQRLMAFTVAGGAFAVAAGAPRSLAISLTFAAGVSYSFLGSAVGTGWWAWMADFIPSSVRATFFGKRSAVSQATNVVVLLSITWALDRVSFGGALFIFYGIIFALAGVMGTIDVVMHLFIPDPGSKAAIRPNRSDLTAPWRDPGFRRFAVAMGVSLLAVNVYGPFVAPYITSRSGLAAPYMWIGITAAISQGAWVLTASFWGRVMDRLGKLPVIIIGGLYTLFSIGYLVASPANFHYILPFIALGGGLLASALFDGLPQVVNTLSEGRSRTGYLAWYWTVFAGAGAIGPVIGGFVLESLEAGGHNGFKGLVIISFSFSLAGALLMMRIRLPEESVRRTLPVLMSPSIFRTYGWMGIIERSDRPEKVWRALRSLGGRSASLARSGVHERLDDPDPSVREEAARTLGRLGDAGDVSILADRLNDPLSTVRVAAAQALGEIGHSAAVPSLLDGLADASEEIREACAAALGRVDDPRAAEVLLSLVSGSDTERVQVSGAMALSRAGRSDAAEEIYQLRRRSRNPVFRRQLAVALADLIGPPGGFYRYLPGSGDSFGGTTADRLFRQSRRNLSRLAARGRRVGGPDLESHLLSDVFPRLVENYESGDYASALEDLDVITTNLVWLWLRRGNENLDGNPALAVGRRVIELMRADLAAGDDMEMDDVLLGVWFLAGYRGVPL